MQLANVIGQRGKKFNDFQAKRLGLVVNDYEGEDTLADALMDTDPQKEPGVEGFEDSYEFTPGVGGFFSQSFKPVTKITRSDLFRPRDENEEQDDVVGQLKFYDAGEAPERPERNKKVDKMMRLAQFANLIGQGLSAAGGGFVSPTDITGQYWDRVAAIDQGYADELRQFKDRVARYDQLNTDLHNRDVLQQRGIDASRDAADLAYDRRLEEQAIAHQNRMELTEKEIEARKEALATEVASKKAYNRIAKANNQNDYLDAIQTERENMSDELSKLEVKDLQGNPTGEYTDKEKAFRLMKDIQTLDGEFNSARKQMGGMVGFDIPKPQAAPGNYGGTIVPGPDGRMYNLAGAPIEAPQPKEETVPFRIIQGPDGKQYKQYADGRPPEPID